MKFTSLIAVVVLMLLTLASGIVHGRLTRRWGMSEELKRAGKLLEVFPDEFGTWEKLGSKELGKYAASVLECSGYVNRVYADRNTGQEVSVALFVGPAGPIATHLPEICYSSRAYQSPKEREPATLEPKGLEGPQQFWSLTFEPRNQAADLLRVYYGWNGSGKWTAPRDARLAFIGRPYLYKLEVAATVPAGTDFKAVDPCRRFLEEFLAAAQSRLLVPTAR